MEFRSLQSLYTRATEVVSSKCFSQVSSKLGLIPTFPLPTTILVDVLLKRASSEKVEEVISVNEELGNLSLFLKLLAEDSHKASVHRLCKLVINGLFANKEFLTPDFLPICLASAFQNEMLKENPKLIEQGILLGEFLYEAGWFKESATVLKFCLENCKEDIPNSSVPCEADHQRSKLIVAILNAQVNQIQYTMEELKSTREQALQFIEKWKQSEGIYLADLYAALSTLSCLAGQYNQALDFTTKALEVMASFPNYYTANHGPTIDILGRSAISYINKKKLKMAEKLINQALDLAKAKYGLRGPKYADILGMSNAYFTARKDRIQAIKVAEECLEIRMEAFGLCNRLTMSAIEMLDDTIDDD